MKRLLLPENGSFYKANLHCHSVLSDGNLTPSEIKKVYMDKGYSIVAYTDHDVLIPHDELTDDNFVALSGFEMEINESGKNSWKHTKTCHICFIAIDKDNVTQPMWNEAYLFANAPKNKHLVKHDEKAEPYERRFDGKSISEIMKIGRDSGFFVTYNHPAWSLENYGDYANYQNMHAFEMFNGGCIAEGYDDYNPRVYDDLLRSGKKIYCIGADDNHNFRSPDSRYWELGVAYTVIKAESLEYGSITKALLDGSFYCSEGPSIYELWMEDNKIFIKCSDADRIICTYQGRKAGVVYAEKGGSVTYAGFDIEADDGYVRITVVDKYGKHACTNAYFVE